MRGFVSSITLSVSVMLGMSACVRAEEEKIPLDKVPAVIMASVNERFPSAKLTSAEKENENGKVVFDIELKHDGRKYEMDIEADGTIIEIEKEIAAKDLPEAVTAAVANKYPQATIQEIMEVNKVKDKKETPDHYEVLLMTADKKKREIEVALDGKSVKGGKAEKDEEHDEK
jgi:uncharacterized membrane protein YkoI